MRAGFTAEQEDELWAMWRWGDSSRLIGRALRCQPSSVRAFLARSGGVWPATRRRSDRHLSATEREEVSRGIAAGLSARAIAKLLTRSPSTISREIARNGGGAQYRAGTADSAAVQRARRPKPTRLATNGALLADVRGRVFVVMGLGLAALGVASHRAVRFMRSDRNQSQLPGGPSQRAVRWTVPHRDAATATPAHGAVPRFQARPVPVRPARKTAR